MAFFNFSDNWETNKTGDDLCETFIKDGRNPKRQYRNKVKHKTNPRNVSSQEQISSINDSFSHQSQLLHQHDKRNQKIVKREKHFIKEVKNKIGDIRMKLNGRADDVIPLNNSFNRGFNRKGSYDNKNSLKRKRGFSETTDESEFKPLLKKIKTAKRSKYVEQPTIHDNSNPTIHKGKHKNKTKREATNGDIAQEHGTNKIKKILTNVEMEHIKKTSKKVKEKKQLLKRPHTHSDANTETKIDPNQFEKRKQQLKKLHHLLLAKQEKQQPLLVKKEPVLTLRQKMLQKLKAARFRFLNEQIYTTTSKETEKIFKSDPEAFKAYHEGYRQQVKRWPLNPLDRIIKSLNKMPNTHVIADFGCGEARLANSVQQIVYSFDLVAVNEKVTACDMAHVPLPDSTIDVAVYCLSLMGTNLKDYLMEANRVLKKGGILKISEVESRFEDINTFTKDCEQFGFKKTWMDLSHNLFYFIDFRKESSLKGKKKLPPISLQPCLYKKR